MSVEQHIHLARPEVVEELTKVFMQNIDKVMKEFEGISGMEIVEACSMVITLTNQKGSGLPNGMDVHELMDMLARRVASTGGEDGEGLYRPSKDKTKTDPYIQ